jgi:hypothetical protein
VCVIGYKVEAYPQRVGAQNSFQLAIAYSAAGETSIVFAYAQLQFFSDRGFVEYQDRRRIVVQNFFTVASNATMTAVLNGTNCNRLRPNQGADQGTDDRFCALAFGSGTNDAFLGPSYLASSAAVALPKPMMYLDISVTSVVQYTDGFIGLFANGLVLSGYVYAYRTNIDTRNGGVDQNQMWLRAGNRTEDLNMARDIIAGNGTLFSPQAVLVATWYRIEAFNRQAGPQNTFQLAMAYSVTGETWLIFAYAQLLFVQVRTLFQAVLEYRNRQGGVMQNFFTIDSNATIYTVLNGTNCNRPGIYAHRINMGGPTKTPTTAPTKAPIKVPTKAPTKAPAKAPTKAPTKTPTKDPTKAPTKAPTKTPAKVPTKDPRPQHAACCAETFFVR